MPPPDAPRRQRADALRNRERLIDAAKAAFGEVGPDVSLEEIARRTGVGIGTLYRHFPTRDAIIEAVYRRDVDQLAAAARTLLAEVRPAEALSRWLHLSLDYLASKRLILPALGTLTGGASALYAHSGASLQGAIELLVGAGIAAGEIRPDVQASDLFPVFSGLAAGVSAPGRKAGADRLIDIVMAGLAAPRP